MKDQMKKGEWKRDVESSLSCTSTLLTFKNLSNRWSILFQGLLFCIRTVVCVHWVYRVWKYYCNGYASSSLHSPLAFCRNIYLHHNKLLGEHFYSMLPNWPIASIFLMLSWRNLKIISVIKKYYTLHFWGLIYFLCPLCYYFFFF